MTDVNSAWNEDGKTFGEWLRETRIKKEMSQLDLAQKSNVSNVAISLIETGVSRNPQKNTREKLIAALDEQVPTDVKQSIEKEESESEIPILGKIKDFNPNDSDEWPRCPGVYILYDWTRRPIYVGKSNGSISNRINEHYQKFWFKDPIVYFGHYIEIKDEKMCLAVEQILIKAMDSLLLVNIQGRLVPAALAPEKDK